MMTISQELMLVIKSAKTVCSKAQKELPRAINPSAEGLSILLVQGRVAQLKFLIRFKFQQDLLFQHFGV